MIINGRELAKEYEENYRVRVEKLAELNVVPSLVILMVGDNPASQVYVKHKMSVAKRLGIQTSLHHIKQVTSHTPAILHEIIYDANYRDDIHGIMVQLPLPESSWEQELLQAIDPEKDVDGLHPLSLGMIGLNKGFVSCTPQGIIKLIKTVCNEIEGKEAVVIGRSRIVGKPVADLLLNENATVTICHSRTKDLEHKVRRSDIVVAAAGVKHLVKGEWFKKDAVVIDVGIHRQENGKLTGDVYFDYDVHEVKGITPVPGGVGPMTISCLMNNIILSAETAHV